jgi:glycosyltransferase involved in cell wall biosynthesis
MFLADSFPPRVTFQAEMQLLVFAHTPPPVHGQSLMVKTLVDGLPAVMPDLRLFHVNPRLSQDSRDVGRFRPGKLLRLIGCCAHAIALRLRHGPMDFYYVPAPGRRVPLYRDWLVLLLCRPFFRKLILHWHAVGLGAWLNQRSWCAERAITQWLLGRAALAIVLAPELVADAQTLRPRKITLVRNGIEDPGEFERPARGDDAPTRVLFIGLCSPAKGIFDTLTAIAVANRRRPKAFQLTVAGGFANGRDEAAFFSQAMAQPDDAIRHVGLADEAQKQELLSQADVFCFPTTHPHEGQPLVLIEALAHDLPIITTRWRAIPGMLPTGHVWFVDPGRPDQIADALLACREAAVSTGERQRHFRTLFTREHHLADLAAALATLK